MSDTLKHIIVADSIGIMLSNSDGDFSTVPTAFALGVASHALMDLAEPDFTVNWFDSQQLGIAAPFLGFQIAGILFVLRVMRKETRNDSRAFRLRVAAIIGGVIPDVIDGIYTIFNPHAWYAGRLLCPWHNNTWQINPMSMWATMSLTLLAMVIRYLPMYIAPFFDRLWGRFLAWIRRWSQS
ncbi:MAG: hypothetical protein R6U92_02050 [Bacillota bacterium]